MQHYTYKIERANGQIQKIRVPVVWAPEEVAQRFPHSLVVLYVPTKHRAFIENRPTLMVDGPAWVYIARASGKQFCLDREPTGEGCIFRQIREQKLPWN